MLKRREVHIQTVQRLLQSKYNHKNDTTVRTETSTMLASKLKDENAVIVREEDGDDVLLEPDPVPELDPVPDPVPGLDPVPFVGVLALFMRPKLVPHSPATQREKHTLRIQ